MTNDMDIWFNGIPIVEGAGNGEFDIWFQEVPLLGADDSSVESARRRGQII